MSEMKRDYHADFDIRSDGEGRTLTGIVVPFDQIARVSDGGAPYQEMFQRGAFTKHLAERRTPLKLLSQHDPNKPLGRSLVLKEDAAGLYGEFRVSNTTFANEQLELARDGVLDSFSVGFKPIKHTNRGGVTVRTEAALREASLVTFPAYEGATLTGIRALDPNLAALALAVLGVSGSEAPGSEDGTDAAEGDCSCDCAACQMCANKPTGGVAGATSDTTEEYLAMSANPVLLARELERVAEQIRHVHPDAGADEPGIAAHSGRLIIARNNLRAALIQRGIR